MTSYEDILMKQPKNCAQPVQKTQKTQEQEKKRNDETKQKVKFGTDWWISVEKTEIFNSETDHHYDDVDPPGGWSCTIDGYEIDGVEFKYSEIHIIRRSDINDIISDLKKKNHFFQIIKYQMSNFNSIVSTEKPDESLMSSIKKIDTITIKEKPYFKIWFHKNSDISSLKFKENNDGSITVTEEIEYSDLEYDELEYVGLDQEQLQKRFAYLEKEAKREAFCKERPGFKDINGDQLKPTDNYFNHYVGLGRPLHFG